MAIEGAGRAGMLPAPGAATARAPAFSGNSSLTRAAILLASRVASSEGPLCSPDFQSLIKFLKARLLKRLWLGKGKPVRGLLAEAPLIRKCSKMAVLS